MGSNNIIIFFCKCSQIELQCVLIGDWAGYDMYNQITLPYLLFSKSRSIGKSQMAVLILSLLFFSHSKLNLHTVYVVFLWGKCVLIFEAGNID